MLEINIAFLITDKVLAERVERRIALSFESVSYSIDRYESPQDLLYDLGTAKRIDIFIAELDGQDPDVVVSISHILTRRSQCTQTVCLVRDVKRIAMLYRIDNAHVLPSSCGEDAIDVVLGKCREGLDEHSAHAFGIKIGRSIRKIEPSDVMCVESRSRKVILHIEGEEPTEAYATLSKLSDWLPTCFCMCHKSFLINMRHVKSLTSEYAELNNGTRIPVSKSHRKRVNEALTHYLRSRI